jgi:hypothetical protein
VYGIADLKMHTRVYAQTALQRAKTDHASDSTALDRSLSPVSKLLTLRPRSLIPSLAHTIVRTGASWWAPRWRCLSSGAR